MATEIEREERRYRRLKKYVKSLKPENQKLSKSEHQELIDAGLATCSGLTDKGKLRLHQLELLEWMRNHPRK